MLHDMLVKLLGQAERAAVCGIVGGAYPRPVILSTSDWLNACHLSKRSSLCQNTNEHDYITKEPRSRTSVVQGEVHAPDSSVSIICEKAKFETCPPTPPQVPSDINEKPKSWAAEKSLLVLVCFSSTEGVWSSSDVAFCSTTWMDESSILSPSLWVMFKMFEDGSRA